MRAGGWVPLYHDLALQGLLLVTLMRGHFVMLMEPISFVRRPLRWLQMIDFHDIHVTFAPNFAYELCLEKISEEEVAKLDLSRWHLAGNASEPVNPVVLRAFTEKFAPAGFRPETFAPIYGMAEATAFVTGRCGHAPRIEQVDLAALASGKFEPPQPDRPTRDVVSCGPPNEVAEVRIVDPVTRQVQPDGGLGEIWLRGRSVAAGYWGRDDNAEVFAATTADGDSGFLRTGDLGALYGGELFVHGRLKDTLIVHGRNIYPQDVELELRAQLPELGKMGAVFAGLAEAGEADAEGLVVTYEVSRVDSERLPALAAQVRHTVSREFGVQVAAVLLVSPGTVQRTTSGKVRRSAMRTLFREGQLRALYRDPPERPAEDNEALPSVA
jgi:acyl-CoA synthetase (AMP-forming)/AMP-acid ligase II